MYNTRSDHFYICLGMYSSKYRPSRLPPNCVAFSFSRVWDIPRCNLGSVSYSAIESIKNGLVCNTKCETGTKVFNAPQIIAFASSWPSATENLSKDRWQIYKIENNSLIEETF